MYASEDLARASDLVGESRFGDVVFVRDESAKTKRMVRSTVPLLPPDREKIPYSRRDNSAGVLAAALPVPPVPAITPAFTDTVGRYISTGSDAAQLVCTQFMMGIYDKGQYFQFLRNELNNGVKLANAIFLLAGANGTLKDSVGNVFPIINSGLDDFNNFRYVAISDPTLRGLVLSAMQQKTLYYLNSLKSGATRPPTAPPPPITFAAAVNAINEIEYLCTREGISFLINHGVAQTHVTVDANGQLVFNQGGDTQAPPTQAPSINH